MVIFHSYVSLPEGIRLLGDELTPHLEWNPILQVILIYFYVQRMVPALDPERISHGNDIHYDHVLIGHSASTAFQTGWWSRHKKHVFALTCVSSSASLAFSCTAIYHLRRLDFYCVTRCNQIGDLLRHGSGNPRIWGTMRNHQASCWHVLQKFGDMLQLLVEKGFGLASNLSEVRCFCRNDPALCTPHW